MRKIIAASFAIALAVGPAAASEKTDVMATVRQYADAFNKGDVKTALGDCAAQSSIIDEIPPHLWQGATGCADWANDFDAYVKKNGITDPIVTLRSPTHVDVTADRAYVVVPANFTFKQNGKRLAERGSILTVALQKVADKWRITGWAWARH
ncbi:MAG TPA: nuclear transport factor 2 family protein [Stellaceae bacterium]|nr:nuclear transport factor 2 family protein [Stellaceae bacterium]